MKELSDSRKGFVPPHSHCQLCGKSAPADRPFCSKKCAEEVYQNEKKKMQSSRTYLVAIVIIIIATLAWGYDLLF